VSESLDIIRTGSEPTNRGRIGFDLGDGVTEWVAPDAMAEYIASIQHDPRRWKVVALDDTVTAISKTWRDVLRDEVLRTRLNGSTAEAPTRARVVIP